MIIQHSKQLLEQLSQIEEQIKNYENVMDKFGIEMDREKLLRLITSQKALGLLTMTKDTN